MVSSLRRGYAPPQKLRFTGPHQSSPSHALFGMSAGPLSIVASDLGAVGHRLNLALVKPIQKPRPETPA